MGYLLPKTTPLQLDAWSIDEPQAQIILPVSSTQAAARCPACETPARHAYSRYGRTLADLPWSDYWVAWRLCVRQFFCRHPTCARRIFTERLPGVIVPWAWRTLRLATRLLALGLALGGAAGVRLSRHFGLTVSRHTRLRVIRRTPWPVIASPQVLSVDEFALRKYHTKSSCIMIACQNACRSKPILLLTNWKHAIAGPTIPWRAALGRASGGWRKDGPPRKSLRSPATRSIGCARSRGWTTSRGPRG